MGLKINSDVPSIFARRQADRAANSLRINQERLSSLLRINRAFDDAAGLAIAERFSSQVRQFNQEINSFQSGSNLIDTAEGALAGQSDVIGRIRELAVQASNGILNDDQRAAINQEAQQLLEQIDTTAQTADFNGINPLNDGDQQIALDAAGAVELNFEESTTASIDLQNVDLSTQAGARDALSALDDAQTAINSNRASLGAQQNGIRTSIEERSNASINLQEAESRIRDLDVARAFLDQTRNEILLKAGIAAIAQSNTQSRNAAALLGG